MFKDRALRRVQYVCVVVCVSVCTFACERDMHIFLTAIQTVTVLSCSFLSSHN